MRGLAALILAVVLVTPAHAHTHHHIFDISTMNQEQQGWANEALNIYDFDWSTCVGHYPHMVTITVSDISPAAGQASHQDGHIVIDDNVSGPVYFEGVLLHEVGHVTDWCSLTDDMRAQIVTIMGAPDWPTIGESFPVFFGRSFSPLTGQSEAWPITRRQTKRIRSLMAPSDPMAWWLTKKYWVD